MYHCIRKGEDWTIPLYWGRGGWGHLHWEKGELDHAIVLGKGGDWVTILLGMGRVQLHHYTRKTVKLGYGFIQARGALAPTVTLAKTSNWAIPLY